MINAYSSNDRGRDGSYTAAASHTTAAAIGKRYEDDFPASANPDKRALRSEDGQLSSGRYVRQAPLLDDRPAPDALQIDYHHPLESWLRRREFRRLLGWLAAEGPDGQTALERIISSYRDGSTPFWRRIMYWPAHLLIDHFRGQTDAATFRRRLAEHKPTLRGLVIVARSVAEFGLTVPQRFVAPLFAV